MRTKILFITLMAFPMLAIGQSRIVTPFTPRTVNAEGKKIYVNPQPGIGTRSLSVGYGFSPVTSQGPYTDRVLPFVSTFLGAKPSILSPTGSNGPISFGVSFEVNPWLEINVPFLYARTWGWQMPEHGNVRDSWFSLLPSVRLSWIRNDWFAFYTRVGVGASLVNRYNSMDAELDHGFAFAWHVSPLGFEFGRQVSFYVEGGYGFLGVVNCGLRVKLGKSNADGSRYTGRQVEWYEKYMKY